MTLAHQTTLGVAHRVMGICLVASAVLLALSLCAGCAVAEPGPARAGASSVATPARVVFLRPSPEASTYNFPVLDEEGNVLALVGPESQSVLPIAPGSHHFELRAVGTVDRLDADLVAGKTYYVLVSTRAVDGRVRWRFTALRSDREWLSEVQAAARRTPMLTDEDVAFDPVRVAEPAPSGRMDDEELRAHTLRREDGR